MGSGLHRESRKLLNDANHQERRVVNPVIQVIQATILSLSTIVDIHMCICD